MTNLEGRVLLRRAGGRRRRAGCRTDLDVIAGLAARLGSPVAQFATDPREVFDELRRASAGGPADYSGITTTGSTPATEPALAVPSADHPGHAAAVPRRASPPRTAGPGSSPSTTAARPRPRRGLPART